MSDPQTTNVGFYIPTRGSDSGTWDLPVNANSSALDAMFANVSSISLTSSPVTLSTPPNAGSSWSGPYQAQSALVKLTGAISANITITIPRAGYYIFWNTCTDSGLSIPAGATSAAKYIKLSGASGKAIGLPPGKKCHVFFDGTDMDYVNMPDSGTAYDLHGVTALPSWMSACTVLPYLIKDGTIYNNSSYPTLAGILGTIFGGTPSVSFAVPDERARARIGYDTGATGRLTTAGSGVNGATMASSGGAQNQTLARAQLPIFQVSIPSGQGSHTHSISGSTTGLGAGALIQQAGGGSTSGLGFSIVANTLPTMHTENLNNTGLQSTTTTVPPAIISFLPLIKT